MSQATPQQLQTLFIFAQVELTTLAELAKASQLVQHSKGSYLIYEGDRFPKKLHAILEGQLLVKKTSSSGKETILRQLYAGEMFAAPALFGDGIAPADVVALTPCQIITLDKAALLEAIRHRPEISLNILSCFNQRLQEMHQTIHGLVSERAVVRLVRVIQYLAHRYGVETTAQGDRLKSKLPHQQLSRMVGISYEESVRLVNKELNGLVKYERGGTITIKDAAALQAQMVSIETS